MTKGKSAIPMPGQRVRGSESGQPIMVAFDLLGRRWAMGVIWNLSEGALTFRQIQDRCLSLSPTVLNRRLKELTAAGLVTRGNKGYILTQRGEDLFDLLAPLGEWASVWCRDLEQDTPEE